MENFIKDLSENFSDDEISLAKEFENQMDITLSKISLTQEVVLLRLNDLKVNLDSTFISEQKISELGESINTVGLLQPVVVSENLELIIGRHRFLAFQKLGLARIPGIVLSLDLIREQIAELDENLVRRNLSVLERGLTLKKRKELYESLFPETKRGCYARGKNEICDVNEKRPAFARKISAEREISARTAQRLIQIVGRLSGETIRLIKNHPVANRQKDLARISEMNVDSQESIAKILSEKKLPSLKKAVEKSGVSDPVFLTRAKVIMKRDVKTVDLVKNMTAVIYQTDNFKNEQLKQFLDSLKLPERKLESWLISLLFAINPGLNIKFENSDESSSSGTLKNAKNRTVTLTHPSLPFS